MVASRAIFAQRPIDEEQADAGVALDVGQAIGEGDCVCVCVCVCNDVSRNIRGGVSIYVGKKSRNYIWPSPTHEQRYIPSHLHIHSLDTHQPPRCDCHTLSILPINHECVFPLLAPPPSKERGHHPRRAHVGASRWSWPLLCSAVYIYMCVCVCMQVAMSM